jgi:hypothetical protein
LFPLLPFKEGLGVVAFDLINLKDKKRSQKPKTDHPQPLLKNRRGAKNMLLVACNYLTGQRWILS